MLVGGCACRRSISVRCGECSSRARCERGVDVKVIAQWQGHRNGGKLILDTYSQVRPEHSERMAALMNDHEPQNIVSMLKAAEA